MKKNNLILGAFLAITAILFSGCGASSSSDSTSTEKVEGSTESTESGGLVTIGSQVWTSKNLDVATYRNGDVIPQVQDGNAWSKLTTGAWCYKYNDASEGTILGKLYNWYAVNDPRGLAPEGFHIPKDSEWTILIDYLGGEGKASQKMQSTWGWENNFNGTNSSGFSGLPGGYRRHDDDGSFDGGIYEGFWWSSTERRRDKYNPTEDHAFYRGLEAVHGLQEGNNHKGSGYSVRCVRTSKEKVEGSTESAESGGVVTIGSQVWTSKNLDVATYRNGDVIPQVQDANAWKNLTTGAWCYYEKGTSNVTKYGKLYNWYAVHDPRGLAPKGYHIPTNEEWTILTDYLGGEEGEKMKSNSGWANTGYDSSEDGNGNNSSGFSGLPGGYRDAFGTFDGVNCIGGWWSSSEYPYPNAWSRKMSSGIGSVLRGNDEKGDGYSVRCLRDTYITDNENLFITDNENLFTNQQITVLDKIISDFEKATSNEIAIVTNESIGDFTNIKEYSVSLANKMGVEKKDKNNGILFVISKKRREIFMATGLGTEQILNNSKCQEIISETIVPYFKKNEYYLGVKAGLEESIKKWTVSKNEKIIVGEKEGKIKSTQKGGKKQ